MKKRAATIFLLLVLMFTFTGLRLADISTNARQAAASTASMSVDLDTLRGTVYDCNMKPLTNGEYTLYAAAKPSGVALAELKGKVLPDVFDSVLERMSYGKPVVVKVDSPINSSEDIKEIKVPERYYSNSLACHVIGYLDSMGKGISGIEKVFDGLLSQGQSTVAVKFSSNAKGRVMLGEEITVDGNNMPENGVVLTIDKNIQQITEDALDASGAECAAAVVIEIESGAIRACVSRPLFNQNNIADSLNDPNSPLINRAFLSFSVGSVFKPVVAAAALKSGISSGFEYNCTGSVTYNGVTFNCHKQDGHGLLDMEGAVANSCNTYFIALALETGAKNIIETAKSFGMGRETVFADEMKTAAGYLPAEDELDSKAAIANISFGQGALLATPVQICSAFSAIARGGVYIQPYLVEGEVDGNGEFTQIRNYGERRQIISQETAKLLQGFLEKVVTEGSGSRAASEIVVSAGKTATAQTGKTENGEEIYNAWFAGYFPADKPKYAVAIIKENGGEGALSCAPVFKEIAEKITSGCIG